MSQLQNPRLLKMLNLILKLISMPIKLYKENAISTCNYIFRNSGFNFDSINEYIIKKTDIKLGQ